MAPATSAMARQARRVEHGERAVTGHQVRAVEQREPLFRLEDERGHARAGQRLGGGKLPVAGPGRPFAEQAERHVGERRQVARRAHRPELGDDGMDPLIEAGHDRLDDDGPHAGRTARERSREQQHDRAHVRLFERRANARGMAQDEVSLEVGALAMRNDDVLELADPGRDAVDRLRAGRQPLDEGATRAEGPARRRSQRHRLSAAGDRLDGFEAERPAV